MASLSGGRYFLRVLLISFTLSFLLSTRRVMAEIHGNFFNYFAYGSNLLAERIHVQIRGAEYVTNGRLADYELFFAGTSHRWQGAAASIRESKGHEVWGCVWRVPNSFAAELDLQEHWYERRNVTIETARGPVICRTYQMKDADGNEHPPSPQYKMVIVRGAEEHQLPEKYIAKLEDIPDNGFQGKVDVPISFLA